MTTTQTPTPSTTTDDLHDRVRGERRDGLERLTILEADHPDFFDDGRQLATKEYHRFDGIDAACEADDPSDAYDRDSYPRTKYWRAHYTPPVGSLDDLEQVVRFLRQNPSYLRVRGMLNPDLVDLNEPPETLGLSILEDRGMDVDPDYQGAKLAARANNVPEWMGGRLRRKQRNDEDDDYNTGHIIDPVGEGSRILKIDLDDGFLTDDDGTPVHPKFEEFVDEHAPDFNPRQTPESAAILERLVEGAIDAYLPPVFDDVSCLYKWSSSAGFKPWNELRLHFWFWLDEPVCFESLRTEPDVNLVDEPDQRHGWTSSDEFPAVDASIYRSAHPQYVADPVLADGIDDPLAGLRFGRLDKSQDSVDLTPEWGVPRGEWGRLEHKRSQERERRHEQTSQESSTVQHGGGDVRVPDAGEAAYRDAAEKELSAAISRVKRVAEAGEGGRYNTCVDQAALVAAMVNRDLLDESRYYNDLTEAVVQCLEADDDSPRNGRRMLDDFAPTGDPADDDFDLVDLSHWYAPPETSAADIYDTDGRCKDVDDGQDKVEQAFEIIAYDDGEQTVYLVVAEPGTGKSRQALERALDLWEQDEPTILIFRTNSLARQMQSRLISRAKARDWGTDRLQYLRQTARQKPKRTKESCKRPKTVHRLNDKAPDANPCGMCPHHLYNGEGEPCEYQMNQADFVEQRSRRQVVFSTYALETTLEGDTIDDDERPVEFDWTDIRQTVNTAYQRHERRTFVPVLERKPKTLALTLEESSDGVPLYDALLDIDEHDAGDSDDNRSPDNPFAGYTVDDEHDKSIRVDLRPTEHSDERRILLDWFGERLEIGTRQEPEDIKAAARRRLEPRAPYAFRYGDESPLGHVLDTIDVPRSELEQVATSDELEILNQGAFNDLVGELGKLPPANEEGRHYIDGDELAELLEPGDVVYPDDVEAANSAVADALEGGLEANPDDDSDSDVLNAVEDAPSSRVARALFDASIRNFDGSTAYRPPSPEDEPGNPEPRLLLRRYKTLDPDQADTTVIGDATADKLTGRVVVDGLVDDHGDDLRRFEVPISPPESTDLLQTKTSDLGKFVFQDHGYNLDRFVTGFRHFDPLNPLWVLSQAVRLDDDGEPRGDFTDETTENIVHFDDLHAVDDDGRVIHHGGSDARGTNDYEDMDAAVLSSFKVPVWAKRALSDAYRHVLDGTADDIDTSPHEAAVMQLETAPMVQASHRIRWHRGNSTVVFLDSRPFPPLMDAAIDEFRLDRLGLVHGVMLADGRKADGDSEALTADLLRLVCKATDGLLIPSIADSDAVSTGPQEEPDVSPLTPVEDLSPAAARRAVERLEEPIESLRSKVNEHFAENWTAAAERAGLEAVEFSTSGTSVNVAVGSFDPDAVEAADIGRAFRSQAANSDEFPSYVTLDGDTQVVAPPFVPVLESKSDDEVREIVDRPLRGGNDEPSLLGFLSDAIGKSEGTARSRIYDLFDGVEGFRSFLRTFIGDD